MRKLLLLFIVFNFSLIVSAQQQPVFSQYMENGFLFNPAMAGAQGFTMYSLTAREQWVGISNPPRTHTFSAQTRLIKSKYKLYNPLSVFSKSNKRNFIMYRPKSKGRIGLGGYVYNDQNSLISRTGFQLAYAYHIYMNTTQLSWGLGISGFQFRMNQQKMISASDDDPLLSDPARMFIPDANAGVYLMNRKYFAGLSVSQLLQSAIRLGQYRSPEYNYLRLYSFNGGVYLYLGEKFRLEPSTLVKATYKKVLNWQADISVTGTYDDQIWAGLSYRGNGDVVVLAGAFFNSVFVGYVFDYPAVDIGKSTLGSHELCLSLRLGSSERKFRYQDRF